MSEYLGIDTSNYTSSVALYSTEKKQIVHVQKPLPVKEGLLGLRQSDAVFEHVKQLPEAIDMVYGENTVQPTAIGVSVRPRDDKGSYMPCFLVGKSVAQSLGMVGKAPVYEFSHQAGHIAAAVFSARKPALFKQEFIAFHVSGGTTEMLLVKPDPEKIIQVQVLGQTLDLNAGQAVDRIGRLLGLAFPSGKALEELALQSKRVFLDSGAAKPVIRGLNCSLSGLENKCEKLSLEKVGKPEIARFCLDVIGRTILAMAMEARRTLGPLPIVFAGGVMSNTIIRGYLTEQLQLKTELYFAEPQYSRDNAAGVAFLAAIKEHRNAK